jgi:hypothetical protein
MKVFVFILFIVIRLEASTPACHNTANSSYCSYTGTIKKLYVNKYDSILIYFNTNISIDTAKKFGFTILNGSAAVVKIKENPEFAKLFYSTALTPLASNKKVSMQMTSTSDGYLQADRIWLDNSQ